MVQPGARALRAAVLSPYPQAEVISRGSFRVKAVRKEMVQRWVTTRSGRYQVERVVVELEQESA